MNKTLTIVILADNFVPSLDLLLQQLSAQVEDFREQVRVIVQVDEITDALQRVVRMTTFAELEAVRLKNNQQRLMAAYSYTDTDYIWALPADARVAPNALQLLMPVLQSEEKSVVLLNCQQRVLPLSPTEVWPFERLGRAAEMTGFFDTYMYPACVVIPGAISTEYWPTYPAAEAHVYAYMRQYREAPVQAIGALVVVSTGSRDVLEDWQRASQWVRLLCTALLQNWVDGTDDIEALHRTCEQGVVFGVRGASTYDALLHWLDNLWKFRWPVPSEATVAAWRVMQQIATDTQYLTPLNRIAELCPGSEGLFAEHLAKQPFWITDLVLRSAAAQGGIVQWVIQPNAVLPDNLFGYTLSLPGVPSGELTQQEIGELFQYLTANKVTCGVVVGTGLGTAAVTAAAGMRLTSKESWCVSIPTEEHTLESQQSITQLATILEIDASMLQALPTVTAFDELATVLAPLVEKAGKQLEFAFIDGINRSRDYVLAVLTAVMPRMAPGGHVFLRNNPYQPLLEYDTQAEYGTEFRWVPHCSRPYGHGLSVMRVPHQ